MTSPYSSVGPQLLELGYLAIPIMPGTKAPGEFYNGAWRRMRNWSERYSVRPPSPSQVTSWCELPDAGVCVLTGKVSGKLVGIDVDCDEVVDAVRSALPDTPCVKVGMKGITLLFRSNLPNSTFDRPTGQDSFERMVDVLSDGRQTLLPPTIHPDTLRPYKWIGEQPLWEVPPEQLPLLPDDTHELLEELLGPFGYSRDRKPHSHLILAGKAQSPFANVDYNSLPEWQRLNAHAWKHADKWLGDLHLYNAIKTHDGIAAVAEWRNSRRGRVLADRSRNLHINVAKNTIVDFGDGPKGYSPIDLVAATNQRSHQQAFEWLAFKTDFHANPYNYDFSQLAVTKEEPPAPAEAESKEVVEEKSERPHWVTDKPLWQVPGLVGEIVQYILDTSTYQQPTFALAAALTLVGAACARQIHGPTASSTHIYVMTVGASTSGKEHPMKCMKQIIDAAGLTDRLMGPGRFSSASAVIKKLVEKPACIAIIDEIGSFLAKGKGRNAPSYERDLFALLRSIWSNDGDILLTEARAQEQDTTLYGPSLSIYGASAVREVFEALSSVDLCNGLMNRFLTFINREYPDPSDAVYSYKDVPQSIISGLQAVANRGNDKSDRYHYLGGEKMKMNVYKVVWDSPDVEKYYKVQREAVRSMMKSDEDKADFYGRAMEYAVRLATIVSVGVNVEEPRVTMETMKWAESVSMTCFTAMQKAADNHMAASAKDVDNLKVRQAGQNVARVNGGWFKVQDIQRQRCARPLKSKEIVDILNYYIEMGEVEREDRTDPKKHSARTTYYRFLKMAEA